MPDPSDFRDLIIADHLRRIPLEFYFPLRPTVKILILVDVGVSFTGGFGIGRVIDLIRDNVDNYVNFEIDLARLGADGAALIVDDAAGPKDLKYDNFRYSSEEDGAPVLDQYDQLWCFGFAPDNSGSSDDNRITNHYAAPTVADLAVLTEWMNNGGGVFATGDHHYLGATMSSQIPRVRHMRRWTNAQQVPTIGGETRHDTMQIQDPSQDPEVTDPLEPAVIPNTAERDDIPQPVEWKRYPIQSPLIVRRRYRPHPVLCGGELGVINVFPDHPHEGWIFEDHEVDLSASHTYLGAQQDDFLTVGGVQPKPEVIAWANTLGDPPHRFAKGDTPAKRFGLIGVYDGDDIDVGRILVDSTWHHWMDLNLDGLEAAADTTNFEKIARYFRNVAVWLSREGQRSQMLFYTTWWKVLSARLFEELNPSVSIFRLGEVGLDVIGREASDCFLDEWILIFLPRDILDKFHEQKVDPDWPIWTRPTLEMAKQAMFGGVLREMIGLRDEIIQLRDEKAIRKLSVERQIKKGFATGAQKGLEEFDEALTRNAKAIEPFGPPCKFELKVKAMKRLLEED